MVPCRASQRRTRGSPLPATETDFADDGLEMCRLVPLARCDRHRQGHAGPVADEVALGREAAPGAAQGVVGRLAGSYLWAQRPPRGAGPQPPQDAVDHGAVIGPPTAPLLGGEEISNGRPWVVGQFVPLRDVVLANRCKISVRGLSRMTVWPG